MAERKRPNRLIFANLGKASLPKSGASFPLDESDVHLDRIVQITFVERYDRPLVEFETALKKSLSAKQGVALLDGSPLDERTHFYMMRFSDQRFYPWTKAFSVTSPISVTLLSTRQSPRSIRDRWFCGKAMRLYSILSKIEPDWYNFKTAFGGRLRTAV